MKAKMQGYITTYDEMRAAINEALNEALKNAVPNIIREVTAKPYMTKEELMDLTGWSSRTLQNLRDTNQISFTQHGYKILYPRSEILQFLDDHKISPR